jgi:NitT/TauT family transport system ATP-binding protein
MILLENISFSYPRHGPLFDGFSWSAGQNETWAVLGPSGCGKTTLLYLLAGLRSPTAGLVTIHGHRVERPRPQTGVILQEYGLLPWATLRQNATLGLDIRRFYGPDGRHAPASASNRTLLDPNFWLSRLGLADLADKYPAQLSGGQRQRAAIARALLMEPDLLLMDEPFASLDAPTREALQTLVLDLRRERGLTIVTVTHSIEEAALFAEKVLILGKPPHTTPKMIPNPGAGDPGFRGGPVFLAQCQRLREALHQA